VLRRLKNDPDLAHIPVFLVTVVDDRRAGLALGATEYFVKPVDHGRLLATLAQHALQPADRQTASVLVVDPDDEVRETVERTLRGAGAEVITCTDGRRGLELSRQHRFDLIVCDMQRVDVDGFALLGALREDPATRATPVFAFTPESVDADGRHVVTGTVLGTAVEGSAAWQSLMTLARSGITADTAVDDRESVG
jgi:CheY-like chemotaxis protein